MLGGTGFIGRAVATELLARDRRVAIMARGASGPGRFAGPARLVTGAVEDPRALDRALDAVSWVVYAVGSPPPARSGRASSGRRGAPAGLVALLRALEDRPEVGVTFLSSGGAVYGHVESGRAAEDRACRPRSEYGRSKLAAEEALHKHSARHGNPAVIARVGNAYGPRQTAADGQGLIAACLDAVRADRVVDLFGGGTAVRDYVWIDDVVDALLSLPAQTGAAAVFNVGSGQGHSVAEVIGTIEETTGRRVPVRSRPARPTDVGRVVLDVSRLGRVAPWAPLDLAEGIRRTWDGAPPPDPAATGVAAAAL